MPGGASRQMPGRGPVPCPVGVLGLRRGGTAPVKTPGVSRTRFRGASRGLLRCGLCPQFHSRARRSFPLFFLCLGFRAPAVWPCESHTATANFCLLVCKTKRRTSDLTRSLRRSDEASRSEVVRKPRNAEWVWPWPWPWPCCCSLWFRTRWSDRPEGTPAGS